MAADPLKKLEAQIRKAGLPTSGECPFQPRLSTNSSGTPDH